MEKLKIPSAVGEPNSYRKLSNAKHSINYRENRLISVEQYIKPNPKPELALLMSIEEIIAPHKFVNLLLDFENGPTETREIWNRNIKPTLRDKKLMIKTSQA